MKDEQEFCRPASTPTALGHPAWIAAVAATIAFHGGCRISPRRGLFVVDLFNGRRAADDDSRFGRGVFVTSVILVGGFSNALDLCDSHHVSERHEDGHACRRPRYRYRLEAVTDDEITTASLQAAVHDAGPIELAARPENRH